MTGSDAKLIRKYAAGYSTLEPFRSNEEKRVRKLFEAADGNLRARMRSAMKRNRPLPQDSAFRPAYATIHQKRTP